MPFELQPPNGQPPTPTDDSLILRRNTQSLTVAVLSFDGSPDQETLLAQVDELSDLLFAAEMNYDENNWFYAGYDRSRVQDARCRGPRCEAMPYPRHNEIWIELFDTGTPQKLIHFQGRNYNAWMRRGGLLMALMGVIILAYLMYREYH